LFLDETIFRHKYGKMPASDNQFLYTSAWNGISFNSHS